MQYRGCSGLLGMLFAALLLLGTQSGIQPPVVLATPVSTVTEIPIPTLTPLPTTSAKALAKLKGRLAFVSNRDGDYEIYSMNANGTNIVKLTDDKANNWDPTWSPDGATIMFTSQVDQVNQIFTMNADGSHVVQITTDDAQHFEPRWSPDGKRIVCYERADADSNAQIYVMDADGTNAINLSDNSATEKAPGWSADGKTIFFDSTIDAVNNPKALGDLYRMDSDGSNRVRLTDDNMSVQASLSPDGKRLAFVTPREETSHYIWVMDVDGSNARPVLSSVLGDTVPMWSPDGKYLVISYPGFPNENWWIVILAIDGSDRYILTDTSTYNVLADWTK